MLDSTHESELTSVGDEILLADTGTNPRFFYLMVATSPTSYAFKKRGRGFLRTQLNLTSSVSPSALIVTTNRYVVGFANGSIYFSDSDSLLPFGLSDSISKMYYNSQSLTLIVGGASGEILVAYGNRTIGFSLNFSYHEHTCKINSIIINGEWIITSDECGSLVQYDMVDQVLLDKVTHPGRTGSQKVMTTQWMQGNFGISVVENQSSVYLYQISDTKTGDSLDQKLIAIVGTIASIPTLRVMIKASMPLLVWLEDFYPYTHHLYPYNDGIKLFLLTLH